MSSSTRRTPPKRAAQKSLGRLDRPLDDAGKEALERFARVLRRHGYGSSEIAQYFSSICAKLPEDLASPQSNGKHELWDRAHVLTLWLTDPAYQNNGEPMALPARGSAASVQGLVKRVSDALEVNDVIEQLLDTGSIAKSGARYKPTARAVELRGSSQTFAHSLTSILNLLRNFEHNYQPPASAQTWFERVAYCPNFPVRDLQQFQAFLQNAAMTFLRTQDGYMARREKNRNRGEETTGVTVGVYYAEQQAGNPQSTSKKRR